MKASKKCPFCGKMAAVFGHTIGDAYGAYFEPSALSVSRWRKVTSIGTSVPLKEEAQACFQCGKVWAELDPVQLQALLSKSGTEELKARLGKKLSV